MRIIIIAFIFICSTSAKAWEVMSHYKDEEKFILLLKDGDVSELSSILRNEKRILSGINLGRIIQLKSDSLQDEVKSYLNKHYPAELSAAFSSSGNMHNPQIKPLRKPFEEALLSSAYIQSIVKVLRENNYEVTGILTEKFMLIDSKYFDAMSWLEVVNQKTNLSN